MKIILGISRRNDNILAISATLTQMGYEVWCFYTDSYLESVSYIPKRLYKFGYKGGASAYHDRRLRELQDMIVRFRPARVLFTNIPDYFTPADVGGLRECCDEVDAHLYEWRVDPLKRDSRERAYMPYLHRVFSYERRDAEFLSSMGLVADYVPVGYQVAYADGHEVAERPIDISFVGTPYKSRLRLLDRLAVFCAERGYRLEVYGPFFKYFWKKIIFRLKHPALYPFVKNEVLPPERVARLYKMSKICINIHVGGTGSLNPRSFEVMAGGNFLLVDKRDDYAGLEVGRDLVVFADADELLAASDYYLQHDADRTTIAAQGKISVRELAIENCLRRILSAENYRTNRRKC